MTKEQFIKNLSVPEGKVDVVIDTDAFNEIDDQFAIAYLIRSVEKLNTRAVYAAPFHNSKSTDPADGIEKMKKPPIREAFLLYESYILNLFIACKHGFTAHVGS